MSEDEKNESSQDKVPYSRFKEVIEEKNEYKDKVDTLKDKAEKADTYKTKLEKMRNKTSKQQKKYALKEEALGAGVRQDALDDVTKVVDLGNLSVDDETNTVKGVEETIEQLKSNKEYLFSESDETTQVGDEFKDSGEENLEDESLREAIGL